MKTMTFLQRLGRSLMLPIAVLPIAGLLLRLGQPDLVGAGLVSAHIAALMAASGAAIFDNMGLLFAIGVATGFAREGHGAACLGAVSCYVVALNGAQVFLHVPSDVGAAMKDAAAAAVQSAWRAAAIHRLDVPLGIVSGLVGGLSYTRFANVALPEYLSFFGGRRFVPIISGAIGVAIAAAVGLAYAPLNNGIEALGRTVLASGGFGLFLFGLLNRLLVVTGLHHILNNAAYFIVGDWHGTSGDLRRFFAGDPSAGGFMSGFFPVMMFGLPAACLAMYHEADPGRRKMVGGMLFSMALTSILTGVTEPIEFSFMFLAPPLYALHAVLTGLAAVVMDALRIRLGFSFSAGLIDYALNYEKASRPLLLLPVGLAYALVYYGIFRFAIRRWNLATPGRESLDDQRRDPDVVEARGDAFVRALGGAANLKDVAACTTRLRLVVADPLRADETALKGLGALAVLRPGGGAVQVILGPVADNVAMEIQAAINRPDTGPAAPLGSAQNLTGILPGAMVAAVGGSANLKSASRYHGRWRLLVGDPALVDEAALEARGIVAIVRPIDNVLHLLTDDFVSL